MTIQRMVAAVLFVSVFLVSDIIPRAAFANPPEARVFTTIEIRGNDRFRDEDILATSGLKTGVPLGQSDLEAAYEALEFTGEFEAIEIRSSGDTLIVVVDEAASFSGGLTFGLGFDTDTGVFGAVGIALDGMMGEGSELRGNLIVAEEEQTLGVALRGDRFWGASRAGGIRLSFGNYEYDNVTYQYRFAQIEPYIEFALDDATRAELRYTLGARDIHDVESAASPIIQAETGDETSSGIGFTLATGSTFDRAQNRSGASWFVRFDQDFTGLVGDTEYSTSQLSFGGKAPVGTSGFALRTTVELGAVVGLGGDDPRVSERFTLGGASLRGFERGTISPRDVCSGCGAGGADVVTELGGNYFAVARTDLLIPLFAAQPKIETFVFYDIGSVWSVDTDTASAGVLQDDQSWRSSAGIGTSFDTNIGKFEAYLALHTDGDQRDDEQEFGLTFRSQF